MTFDEFIPLDEVPRLLPPRRRRGRLGRHPIGVSTVWRWTSPRGAGGIVLESWIIAGRRHTTIAALERFFAAVNAKRNGDALPVSAVTEEVVGELAEVA